jgi:hypothetical protein
MYPLFDLDSPSDGKKFIKEVFDGYLDWTQYPMPINTRFGVEVQIRASSSGTISDHFDHNFLHVWMELCPNMKICTRRSMSSKPT